MAGRGDIEAGRATVKVAVDSSPVLKFVQTMNGQLRSVGKGFMAFGAATMGAGAGIIGALGGAVAQFASMGSELADVSGRTGIAVGSLAELKYGAEQTGASLSDVEVAARGMAKKGFDVAKFDKYAAEIAAIEDPTKRAKRAMDVFGKSGTMLLPMLGNLQKLRQEARDLGLVPTDQAVADADEIGDSFDKITSIGKAAAFEIGAALAPVLKPGLEVVKNIAAAGVRWVKQNQGIIRTVAAIGAGLLAAGAVIAAIGGGLFALGSIGTVASAAFATIAAVAGALVSPLGIVAGVVLAIGGGLYAWVKYTESGKAAFASLLAFAAPIFDTLKATVGGIFDALKGGDVMLAGQIAIKGLQLVLMQGLDAITGMIGGQFGDTISGIGQKLLGGDFVGAWNTALKQMWASLAGFGEGIIAMFTVAARAATDVWAGAVNKISDSLLDASASGGVKGKIASFILGEDMQAINAERERLDAALGLKPTDATAEAKAAARAQTQGVADGFTKLLDGLDQAAQQQTAEAEAALAGDTGGARGAGQARIDQLRQELAALRASAAQAAAAAAAGGPKNAPPVVPDAGAVGKSFGSFSAAAIAGAATGPTQRLLNVAERQAKAVDDLLTVAGQQLIESRKFKPARAA